MNSVSPVHSSKHVALPQVPFDPARVNRFIKNGRYDDACKLCESVDAQDKHYKDAMYSRGVALKYQCELTPNADYREAIKYLVLAFEARHPRAAFELGKHYLKFEKYEQALQYLELFSTSDADALGLDHSDFAYADFCIGNIYFCGKVADPDSRKKSSVHFQKSFHHGKKYGL